MSGPEPDAEPRSPSKLARWRDGLHWFLPEFLVIVVGVLVALGIDAVRAVVDRRSAGRGYAHRLRDWNNDARTTLAEVHAALDEALAGIPGGPQ
jgi:hypothetical protein